MIKRHLLVSVAHPLMNPISEHIGWWKSLTCIDTLKISSVSKYSCKQAFDLKKYKVRYMEKQNFSIIFIPNKKMFNVINQRLGFL